MQSGISTSPEGDDQIRIAFGFLRHCRVWDCVIICHPIAGATATIALSHATKPSKSRGRPLRRLRRRLTFALLTLLLLGLVITTVFPGSRTHRREQFRARFQLTERTRTATMSAGINALRVPATGNHTASVIWLHGLGDSGKGWRFLSQFYDFLPVCYPAQIDRVDG